MVFLAFNSAVASPCLAPFGCLRLLLSCFIVLTSAAVESSSSANTVTGTLVSKSRPKIVWRGKTPQDLSREYGNIFRTHNRNAASHLWASFLLDRSENFDQATIEKLFAGFCAVSGSPVPPSEYNRYGMTLDVVPEAVADRGIGDASQASLLENNQTSVEDAVVVPSASTCKPGTRKRFGFMHYCCWPCVCDTQDFIRADSKTVALANGETKQYWFTVIANPCAKPEKLSEKFYQPFDGRLTSILESAGEVKCLPDGTLKGATLSDHGYPIINMHFDSEEVAPRSEDTDDACNGVGVDQPGRISYSGRQVKYQSECEFKRMCEQRAQNGYNSGMGEIFRRVAGISAYKQPACPSAGTMPPALADMPEGVDAVIVE